MKRLLRAVAAFAALASLVAFPPPGAFRDKCRSSFNSLSMCGGGPEADESGIVLRTSRSFHTTDHEHPHVGGCTSRVLT